MNNFNDMYFTPDSTPKTNLAMATERLHQICHLAKVGAAASDSLNRIPHISDALETLQEVIYRLASEGVEYAEQAEKVRKE